MYSYSRTRTASSDGPYVTLDPNYLLVWVGLDSYGRVHHVTGDLVAAEKLLEKYRRPAINSQKDLQGSHDLRYNISEVTVQGSKGSGRIPMVVEFHLSPVGGKFSPDDLEALRSVMPKLKEKAYPGK